MKIIHEVSDALYKCEQYRVVEEGGDLEVQYLRRSSLGDSWDRVSNDGVIKLVLYSALKAQLERTTKLEATIHHMDRQKCYGSNR